MIQYQYKIVKNLNNKFYYGIHSTDNINDGYFGSGKRLKTAIKKYGKQNFSKYIIEYFDSREKLLQREHEIITDELLISNNCYNLVHGGSAGQLFYVPVKDKDDNVFRVSKDDPRYLSGELVGVCKNTVTVKDAFNNKFRVSKDDPRYLSGELVGVATDCAMKGKLVSMDKEGNKFVVSIDDPRYLSGELTGTSKNTQWINNGIDEKMVSSRTLSQYTDNDWVNGRIKKCWVHNENSSKLIPTCKLLDYLNNGWLKGKH